MIAALLAAREVVRVVHPDLFIAMASMGFVFGLVAFVMVVWRNKP